MKTKIFAVLALITVCCTSCSKDDKVELEKIVGLWNVDHGGITFDSYIQYTFNEDMTCWISSSDGGPKTITEGTYQISIMGNPRVLTISTVTVTEQYKILKLTDKEMKLRNVSDYSSKDLTLKRAESAAL